MKKALSWLLALAMVIGMVPVSVFAAEAETTMEEITLGDFSVAGVGKTALSKSEVLLSQKTLIAVPYCGATLRVSVNEGYQIRIHSGDNYNNINQVSDWLNDGDTYTLPMSSIYMRINIQRRDGDKITHQELERSAVVISYESNSSIVDDNADAAQTLKNTDMPVLIHLSDIHGDTIRAERAASFAAYVGADALMASGDLTAYQPDDWGNALFDAVGKYPSVDFLYGIGNHDATGISAADYQKTIYNSYFSANPRTPDGKTYYYQDLAEQKLRIISVNQQEGAVTTTSGGTCYSQEQVDWLVDTLKSTPAGYGVILMYHSPETTIANAGDPEYPEFFQIGNRYDRPTNTYSAYSGTFLMDLIDAFMLRADFTWNYSEKDGASAVTVNADFSDVADGVEFIAHVTGHVHSDSITYLPGTTNKQLLLGVTCTNSMYGEPGGYYGLADYSDLTRTGNTADQDAFNAYMIDRQNKTVRVLRIGAQHTVSGGVRSDMEIPYSVPFKEGEYLFDTTGLVKLDLSDVEWVNYGIQEYGLEPTYNVGLRISPNRIFDVPYEEVTFYIKINAPYEIGIRSGATDTTMSKNYYWLNNKELTSGSNNRGHVYTIPAGHTKFIFSVANVSRDASNNTTTAGNRNPINFLGFEAAGLEIWYAPEEEHTCSYTAAVTAPTCTEQGYTTYTCACGDSYVDDYVDANGHTYENGVCTDCGEAGSALAGKTISILGASISTYAGTSNGAAADTTNSTIRNNAKYYPHSVVTDVTLNDTWWMQVCDDLGLRLLVNNAWSGSALLHERSGTVGAYVDRCVQLHDDTGDNAGEMPDIIGIQMGTNDFQYYKDTLGTADIDYAELIAQREDGTYAYATPATSLEAAAIVLHKISVRYPKAEVYYLNISQRVDGTDELIRSFNAELEKVVTHFGAHIVDIYGSAITMEDFDTYIGDGKAHPNKLGMDAYTEAFKKSLLDNTAYAVDAHMISLNLDGVTADYGDDKRIVSGKRFTVNLTAMADMELDVTVTMGGKDVTAAVYANGIVTIDSVTDDVTITAKAVYEPKAYRWEFDGTELVCVDDSNILTKNSGTTLDGVFSKTSYTLEKQVLLLHDLPWAVEWKSEGTFMNTNGSTGARVFTSDVVNANYNARYIFKSAQNWIVAMGEKTSTGSHNYGIALADYGIDGSASHTYRLENRVADGSNMIYLFVDGKEIGPMNHYYIGTTSQNTTSNWLSGKDFEFPYMGTDTHGFTNCSIEYIQVWEAACTHNYTSNITAPTCTEQGYTIYTCSVCGDSYVSDYVDAVGHTYANGVCAVCGVSILGSDWIAPEFARGDYSMVVVPDTQNLVQHWPEIYYDQMQWIADNRENLNIQAVLHMGDMVNNNNDSEWTVCENGTDIIDSAGIPWMPMMGNHDNAAWFNSYYDYETYGTSKSWFGGSYHADKLDHTYWFVTAGEREYMILSLGWAPSWDVLDWAKGVVEEYSDKSVIIVDHAYINKDGTLLNKGDAHCVSSYLSGYPDGDDVWNTFKEYGNVVLAMGGHIHCADLVTYVDENGSGQEVTSLLVDRQNDDIQNRYAMVAVLTFHTDSEYVDVNWYSTRYDALYKTKNQFSITVPVVCEHSYTTEVTEATCTQGGGTTYTCAKCGYSYLEATTSPLNHKYEIVSVAPSCTTVGYTESICSVCGHTERTLVPNDITNRFKWNEGHVISALNGNMMADSNWVASDYVDVSGFDSIEIVRGDTVNANTTLGIAFYDASQKYISGAVHTDKMGSEYGILVHDLVVPENAVYVRTTWYSVNHGNYAGATLHTFYCKGYSTEIPAVGHDYRTVVTAPTCTEQGYTTYTCTTCGDSYVDDFTDVRPLNILMIGNSFSWDAADFWYDMQTSMTYDAMKAMLAEPYDVHLAVMYKGSATLGYHATCAANDTRAYTFQEIGPETNYIWEPSSGKNATNGILEHLQERDWDIIVIQSYQHEADGTQPRSTYTGGSAQFVEPSASVGFLLDYFAQNEPGAEVYYYMPWSSVKFYGAEGTAAGFEGIGAYTGEHIIHMTGDSSGKKLAGIIPVGTAIENARTTYLHALNYTAGTGATALLKDPQIGLLYDSQHLSFGVGRYIAGLTVAQSLIPQEMRKTAIEWPSVKDSPAVGSLPEEYSVIAQMAAENAMRNPYDVTPIANYDTNPADRVCDAIAAADYTGAGLTDEASVRVHIETIIRNLLASWKDSDFTLTIYDCRLEDGVLWNLDAEVTVRVGYTTRTAQIFVTEGSEHRFGDWIHITAPTADSLGLDQRVCSKCGHVDRREVEGAWQKYNLADHLQELPNHFCAQTNLWSRLEPESVMIDHMGKWVSAGTNVYSVTIPVAPGDRIYANSFGVTGSKKGIQVSFIGTYGIIKTTFSSQTYQEFTNNGGYLVAPEGSIAVNVPVWDYQSDNELYILNAGQHTWTPTVTAPTCTEDGYTTYTCTVCGDSYVDERIEKLGHDEKLIPGKSATCTESGLTDGKQCRRCGVVTVKQEIISALGHSYGEWYVSKAPTYTEAGEKRRDCVACDHFELGVLAALKHSYTAVVTEPTCTEDGYTTYTCTECGDSYVDDRTEKLGHDEQLIPGKAATCTESGLTDGKQCRRCGVVTVKQEIISALGHAYAAVVTTPTCTEGGYTTYTCTECGDGYVDDRTEKLGHDEQLIPGKAATCTESGLTDGKQCRRCGVVTVEQEIIAALGHSYTAVVTAPTCTEGGYTTYTCTTCGDSYVDDRTEKLGHDEQLLPGKSANCTESGLTDGKQCRRCDIVTVKQEIIAALGHNYDAVVTTPTCTEDGYTAYACTVCGDSYVDDRTEKLGHSYEAVITKPTCTEDGYTTYTCTTCGDSYVDDRTDKLGHDEKLLPGKAATCTADGLTEGKHCAVCGEVLVAQTVVPSVGHTEVVDKAVAATCTATGLTEGKHCSVCGEVLIAQSVIPAKGHSFTNYVSDRNATVEENGTKTAKCDFCDATDTVVDEGGKLTHTPGEWKVIKKPTCVEPGVQVTTCTVCGEEYEEIIEPHGEPVVEIEEIPATCTTNGKTEKIVCSECGKVVQRQKTIKKGHLLTVLCSDESGHWYACEREDCDAIGKVSNHRYDVDSCEAAACCEDCGYEKAPGEHIPGKWKVKKKATCIEDGLRTTTCKVCKEKIEEVIEAHGEAVVEIPEQPATCTENGKTAKIVCSECGKVVQRQKTIKKGHLLTVLCSDESGHWYACEREDCDAIGKVSNHRYDVDSCEAAACCEDCGYEKAPGEHIPGKWKVTKKATCIEDGLRTATCKVCREKIEDVIKAHGEPVVEIPEQPATCTENGKTAKIVCSECGKVVQRQKTIKKVHLLSILCSDESGHWYACEREDCDATGKTSKHKYTNGVCKTCGYEKE